MATYHIVPDIRILTFPIWVALLVLLSVGLGLWTSALNVRYRDVQYILPVFLQMLLYASPLAYPVSKIPANLLTLYHLNPLVSLITGLRWSLLPGSETPHWGFVIYSFAFTLVLLIAGAFTFKRMERLFADVI
jgi:lipopolysaccharide transport system permease protein